MGLANCRVALRILQDQRTMRFGGVVRLSDARLETAKRSAMRVLDRQGTVRVCTQATLPLTAKPLGVRMGRGKGDIVKMVAVPRPGQILMEVHGIKNVAIAVAAMQAAANKLAVPCRVVTELRAKGEQLLDDVKL